MKKNILFLGALFLLTVPLAQADLYDDIENAIKDAQYIFCIDGGGSKTTLQAVTKQKEHLFLRNKKNLIHTGSSAIIAGASNINKVKAEGVINVFNELFDDLQVFDSNKVFSIKECAVIAGLAGAASEANQKVIKALLEDMGFSADKIVVCGDVDLALEQNSPDAILIAGTGSSCFGTDGKEKFLSGGLGRVLGDEGSGYAIGRKALKAAMRYEQRTGKKTSLLERFKDFFKTEKLSVFAGPVDRGEITPSQIASLAKIVFDEASKQDAVAQKIIKTAQKDLADILYHALRIIGQTDCKVHVHGGIFCNENANDFIEGIKEICSAYAPRIINKAHTHVATEVVFNIIDSL